MCATTLAMSLLWCRQHQEQLVQQQFSLEYSDIVSSDCLMYGNYLVPGAEPKVGCTGALGPWQVGGWGLA